MSEEQTSPGPRTVAQAVKVSPSCKVANLKTFLMLNDLVSGLDCDLLESVFRLIVTTVNLEFCRNPSSPAHSAWFHHKIGSIA